MSFSPVWCQAIRTLIARFTPRYRFAETVKGEQLEVISNVVLLDQRSVFTLILLSDALNTFI